MKKVTILAVLSIIMFSAGALFAQSDMQVKQADNSASIVISPEKFQDFAEANVGKEVEIQGMVVHVCRHGGKKMFIIGEDPEMRVKITASDKVNEFKPELEGSTVTVKGIIEPIAEEAVPEEEKKSEDADHTNYYHKPQYAVSCLTFKVQED